MDPYDVECLDIEVSRERGRRAMLYPIIDARDGAILSDAWHATADYEIDTPSAASHLSRPSLQLWSVSVHGFRVTTGSTPGPRWGPVGIAMSTLL